jgi:hypothetical protein
MLDATVHHHAEAKGRDGEGKCDEKGNPGDADTPFM